MLQSYGDNSFGEAVAVDRQHYGQSGLLGSVPYPGIGKSIEEMKRTGLRIYLATSKRGDFCKPHFGPLKFATYFDGIHGSVPNCELDHKPEWLAYILSKHGLSPSYSLMVGDRRHDISRAHTLGMRGLGVLWGYSTRDELETAGADQLVDSPADLGPYEPLDGQWEGVPRGQDYWNPAKAKSGRQTQDAVSLPSARAPIRVSTHGDTRSIWPRSETSA